MEIKLTLTPEQVDFLRNAIDHNGEIEGPLTEDEAAAVVLDIIDAAMMR